MSLYLHLLHGRPDPDAELSGWGFNGPVLGPFAAVQVTYLTHVFCYPENRDGGRLELAFFGDLLVWEGAYYGDFEITSID